MVASFNASPPKEMAISCAGREPVVKTEASTGRASTSRIPAPMTVKSYFMIHDPPAMIYRQKYRGYRGKWQAG